MSRAGGTGLAEGPLTEQRDRVLGAWDGFRALAATADLDRPSRLPGWSGHDVVAHLGAWPDPAPGAPPDGAAAPGATTLDRMVRQARSGVPERHDPGRTDRLNAAVVAAHRDATREDLLAALDRGRERLARWFAEPDAPDGPRALGGRLVDSVVGPLPLLTVVAASGYELAVHALDLAGPPPAPALLDAGLAALLDVTGVFAHRRGLRTTLTAWTGDRGWQVHADPTGWRTVPVTGRRPPGAAVTGEPAVLLDVSAGRRQVPALLVTRALRVHGLAEVLRLAPIVEEVPGLPGGPALRAAARWVGGAGRLLSVVR